MRKKICLILLSFIMICEPVVSASATSLSDAKIQHQKTQSSLESVENAIDEITTEKEQADEKLGRYQNQLVDILTSITICEEEIETKKNEIDSARDELLEVQHQEEEQYDNMKKRVKFMYEQGDKAYFQLLLESGGYADMVNKADYVEKLYAYDKELLAGYVASKEKVTELKAKLEDEEADLEAANYELEQEQNALELLVEEQKATVADFNQQLANAKEKAANYKAKLEEENKQIQKLELEEQERIQKEIQLRKEQQAAAFKKAQAAANKDGNATDNAEDGDGESNIDTTDFSAGAGESIDVPTSGSSLGQQVVNYACQFVGNPYVYGGTSLTNGTDCSGFTMSVYAHFGISIPRDSTSQRSCGIGVDYASAQPGDLICYAGHVALYMGGGMIVHASTERTGITYSAATYRTILAVRRVIY